MTEAATTATNDADFNRLHVIETACRSQPPDSDSGHEPTSSSSDSNCSDEQCYQDQDQVSRSNDCRRCLPALRRAPQRSWVPAGAAVMAARRPVRWQVRKLAGETFEFGSRRDLVPMSQRCRVANTQRVRCRGCYKAESSTIDEHERKGSAKVNRLAAAKRWAPLIRCAES
jgi:hypothetical protein